MGTVFGILLLSGFLLNSIFKGFTFANIVCIIISLLVLGYGLYSRKKTADTTRRLLPGIAIYLAAIALIAIISVIFPADGQGQFSVSSQINKSAALIKNNNHQNAQQILLKLDAQDPSNALVSQNLAATYIMAHDPDNALNYLGKAYRTLYFNENILFNYGLAYYQKQDFANALKCFEGAISLNPTMVNAHIYAGTMCYKLRYLRKAIYHLENARFLAPDMPDILYNLGKANLDMFEYSLAEKNLKEALAQNPSQELKDLINKQLSYLESVKGGSGDE